MLRDSTAAASSPTASPMAISPIPLRTIISRTSPRAAPSAIRIPISCVRRATAYDITP